MAGTGRRWQCVRVATSLVRLADLVRSTFWLVPALCAVSAVVLALGMIELDQQIGDSGITFLLFPGPPEGARSLLSAVITSMISFTGLVFSITIVVLQLTSAQFSPRVLRNFLRDRSIQWSLGVFVATFVYAMTVIRAVLGTNNAGAFVPRIAVTTAFVLVLLSVGLFIHYIHHIANMIRAASITLKVAEESRNLLERRFPPAAGAPPATPALPSPCQLRTASRPGTVVAVKVQSIIDSASAVGRTVVLVPRIGDFVPAGAPLFTVHVDEPGSDAELPQDWLAGQIALDDERTMEQDLAFGFRQLVDIAERALSPSTNDPTTACQALDGMHDLLRRLATRRLHTGRFTDSDGRVRLLVPQYSFVDYLSLVVAEVWRYGSDAAQVPERLTAMLRDLDAAALREHQPAVRHWLQVVAGEPSHVEGADGTMTSTPPGSSENRAG